MSDARTDEALMASYVVGEQAAFGQLFARYGPRLTRMFARDVSLDDARDLTQQTFLQMHRARRDFKTGAPLRPWVYTIARNLLRQHHRSRGRRRESQLDWESGAEPPAVGTDPEQRAVAQQVRRVLSRLPFAQAEVIALHWFEGLSFREVGQVVGAKESAVKVRAHRGYTKLRELLCDAAVTAGAGPAYGDTAGQKVPR